MRILVAALLVVAGCSFGESTVEVATAPDACAERGPWATWPEADWVREIVEAGGYKVVGETGSAIVASGKGHEFFVWTTKPDRPVRRMAREENWRRLARVRNVTVYGDNAVRRLWLAQKSIFWVESGPRRGSVLPAAGRLAPVIDASLRLPFRDPCP